MAEIKSGSYIMKHIFNTEAHIGQTLNYLFIVKFMAIKTHTFTLLKSSLKVKFVITIFLILFFF